MILKDIIKKFDKSNIKAGDGLEKGNYPLYTCSPIVNKYLNDYLYEDEALIISTGGNFSIHYVNGKFNYSTDCYVFNTDKYNLKYLYYYLLSKKDDINKMFRGAGLKHLNKNEFVMLNIKDISLNEQCDIVNQLDKVNEMIGLRKQEIEKCNNLIKSQFVEMFGDPNINNKNWKKRKLFDECEIITGNTPSRKIESYYGNYIEWIKSDNINEEKTYLTTAKEYLSEDGMNVGRYVDKNCILMTCIAGSLKSIGNVSITNRKVSFNQQINGIVPKDNNVYFLYELFILSKDYLHTPVNMSLKGILSKNQLGNLEFIFPPIELQNKFGKIFEQIDKQKFEFEKSLKKLEELQASLMQEYFG